VPINEDDVIDAAKTLWNFINPLTSAAQAAEEAKALAQKFIGDEETKTIILQLADQVQDVTDPFGLRIEGPAFIDQVERETRQLFNVFDVVAGEVGRRTGILPNGNGNGLGVFALVAVAVIGVVIFSVVG